MKQKILDMIKIRTQEYEKAYQAGDAELYWNRLASLALMLGQTLIREEEVQVAKDLPDTQ